MMRCAETPERAALASSGRFFGPSRLPCGVCQCVFKCCRTPTESLVEAIGIACAIDWTCMWADRMSICVRSHRDRRSGSSSCDVNFEPSCDGAWC